jgi:tetratricopeptide (TPR) repeat protein
MAKLNEEQVSKQAKKFFEKGVIAMERNNLDYAISMFIASIDAEPQFFRARQLLHAASVKMFTESGKGVFAHIVTTISALPQLLQGQIAMSSKKYSKAMSIAERVLQKDPFNLPFLTLLCKASEKADMPEVAIDALKAATKYYSDNTNLLTWLGDLYSSTDDLEEAKNCYETVVNLKPNDAKALKTLKDAMARGSMERGGWAAAQEGDSFRHAIKKGDAQEGEEETGSDDVTLLIQDALDKLHDNPKDMNMRRKLISLYQQANRFDDAIKTLKETQQMTSAPDPTLEKTLTEIYTLKFDYEIEELEKKNEQQAANNKKEEKKQFLLQNISDRVKRYPNDLPLRYDYGVLLLETGEINEAIKQLQVAERNPQRKLDALYYLGLCFKKKGQFDLAKQQLETAAQELTEMNELKKNIFYELGAIYEQQGQLDEAIKYYKQIYQVDIGYKDIADKIETAYKKQNKSGE